MGKQVYNTGIDKRNLAIPVTEGGTGAIDKDEACDNLGLLRKNMKDKPGGPAGLGNDGKIKSTILPPSLLGSYITIEGPTTLFVTAQGTYTINGYDNSIAYTLTAIRGTVARSANMITYVAPADLNGECGFILNGRRVIINLKAPGIDKPSILAPIAGSSLYNETYTSISSPFVMIGGLTDTHAGSQWQLSDDPTFTTVIKSSTLVPADKTSWQITDLRENKVYYVRVRYNGTTLGYSEWSNTVSFTTQNFPYSTITTIKRDPLGGAEYETSRSVCVSDDGLRIAFAVATNGVTLTGYNARVYIYRKENISWVHEATLVDIGTTIGDQTGMSITCDAAMTRIVVGVPFATVNGLQYAGKLVIWNRVITTWNQGNTITEQAPSQMAQFGNSVSISRDGTWLAVGAPGVGTIPNEQSGKAYLLMRNYPGWDWKATMTLPSSIVNSYGFMFGANVVIGPTGAAVLVSAYGEKPPGVTNRIGAVYLFAKDGNGDIQQVCKIPGPTAATTSDIIFGADIDMAVISSALTIAVGTANGNPNTNNNVYIYRFPSIGNWDQGLLPGTATEEAVLSSNDNNPTSKFGNSISLNVTGDLLAIGANKWVSSLSGSIGTVYLFKRTGTSWTQYKKYIATVPGTNQGFGTNVHLSREGSVMGITATLQDNTITIIS